MVRPAVKSISCEGRRSNLAGQYPKNKKPSGQLEDQEQRIAPAEIPVPGLVVEQVHPPRTAQRPAQNSGKKQRPFRDAPLAPPRPALVDSHETERRQIRGQQIQSQTE